MFAKFVGTHIHKDLLKAGIAFYPSESDKSYAVQYVSVPIIPEGGYPGAVNEHSEPLDKDAYRAWIESLPTKMQLNPAFTHFIKIDPSITKPQLEAQIQEIFTPDVLTSADEFLSIRGTRTQERRGFSSYRKMMAVKKRLGNGLVLPKGYNAKGLITAANNKFKGLGGELDGKGKIIPIEPDTIDIGAAATDRGGVDDVVFTIVNLENPANADGKITSCEIWINERFGVGDIYVGTFSASDFVLTVRDSESIGDRAAGSKQTASGLDITVETGDYIGKYDKNEQEVFELDEEGGQGILVFEGECIDPSDSETFTDDGGELSGFTLSLYGEGTETPQTISDAGAIASLEAFGGSQVNLWTHPSGIATGEAFGTAVATGSIIVTGISSSEAFESPQVNLNIAASAIDSLEAFGTPQLNFILSMTGIISEEAFGTPKANFILYPNAISTAESFGTPIIAGPIIAQGIASAEAFGTAKVSFIIYPTGITGAEVFGNLTLAFTQTILPDAISSVETFGSPTIAGPIIAIGITSDEAFGTPKIEGFIIVPSIASSEAFGMTKLNLELLPDGIASAEAFGTAKVNLIVFPSGITSEEAFGALQVNLHILAQAIASAEALGAPVIAGPITVSGIASTEAFGTAQVNFIVYPSGVTSAEAFGTPQLNLKIEPVAIASAEAFGTLSVNFILYPSSIATLEAFGTPIIAGPIIASGIASAEAFGTPQLNLIISISPFGIASEEAFGTPTVRFVIIPPAGLPYIIEVHDSSGNLEAILDRVEGMSLAEAINEAPILEFAVPGDEDKLDGITRAKELWLRDYDTGTVIKKFLLYLERDVRT